MRESDASSTPDRRRQPTEVAMIEESPRSQGLTRRAFVVLGTRRAVALGFALSGAAAIGWAGARRAFASDQAAEDAIAWQRLTSPRSPVEVLAAGSPGGPFGPLGPPDANGLRLPPGFRGRIVARSGKPVAGTRHVWHADPDGGAVFATDDGGWIYVSNAEARPVGRGGAGAIRFDAEASIVDAYSILTNTTLNCAGGRTPWKTWLSCEERPGGRVFECDPFARGSQGVARPALGLFQHEGVAIDPVGQRLYLTEDEPDGLLYRFTPDAYPSLVSGRLEAAEILDPEGRGPIVPGQSRPLAWHPIGDPSGRRRATRQQAPKASRFNGGEGIDSLGGGPGGPHAGPQAGQSASPIHFSTKGDDRIWQLDPRQDRLSIRFDPRTTPSSALSGVDNVLAAPNGDVYVAEDGGDLQIVALTAAGAIVAVVQVVGHAGSEITGPALSPDGRRLYFSSQRSPGTTFEVEGPFLSRD